jgi:hypothetical protein
MMTTSTFRSLVFLWGLIAAGTAPSHACVTMVADLYGTVAVADTASAKPQDQWPVQLLQCLTPRKVLSLQAGARATLFFPANGMAFELRGAGRFEVGSDAVQPLADSPAPSRVQLNAAFRDIKLDRANLVPAGVRMRDPRVVVGPALLEPRGMVVSADPPVFRWEAIAGSPRYRFRLASVRMDIIYETLTDGTELVLPAQIPLTPGERLIWHVEEASAIGRTANRWQEFVVATPEARGLAQGIDQDIPSPSAAERNLRDVLLMQKMARGKSER